MNYKIIPPAHRDAIIRLFKTGDQMILGITSDQLSILHAAVGIAGEAAELEKAVLPVRLTRSYVSASTDSPWKGYLGTPDVDVDNILEELGDHLFYEGALRIATDLVQLNTDDECDMNVVPPMWTRCLRRPSITHEARHGGPPRQLLCDLVSVHSVIAGDILDAVKKHVMHRKNLDLYKLRRLLLQDCWVVWQMAALLGVDEEQLRALNMAKLLTGPNARYKGGQYSDEAAQLRKDKQAGE